MYDPFANLYFMSDLLKLASFQFPVICIILIKSFMAPRFKCGIDSDTIDISDLGVWLA